MYKVLSTTDWEAIKFEEKQRWFANLYVTHFGRKMVASLDDVSKLIEDK
jgi:hypothetical protein